MRSRMRSGLTLGPTKIVPSGSICSADFTGGAAEAGDHGPAATALREASEETALDPGSVHILGVLPAIALPESGFLLTPVIAWSEGPIFTGTANIAEVSQISTLPLFRQTDAGQQRPDPAPDEEAPAEHLPAMLGAGTSAILDMIRGMLWGPMNTGENGAMTGPTKPR